MRKRGKQRTPLFPPEISTITRSLLIAVLVFFVGFLGELERKHKAHLWPQEAYVYPNHIYSSCSLNNQILPVKIHSDSFICVFEFELVYLSHFLETSKETEINYFKKEILW